MWNILRLLGCFVVGGQRVHRNHHLRSRWWRVWRPSSTFPWFFLTPNTGSLPRNTLTMLASCNDFKLILVVRGMMVELQPWLHSRAFGWGQVERGDSSWDWRGSSCTFEFVFMFCRACSNICNIPANASVYTIKEPKFSCTPTNLRGKEEWRAREGDWLCFLSNDIWHDRRGWIIVVEIMS